MRSVLIDAMRRRGGVIRRDEAIQLVPLHVIDDAVRSAAILVAHPGVYRLPEASDTRARRRAALAYCPSGALSHTDELDEWRLPCISSARIHVTVSGDSYPVSSRGIRLHRRRGFVAEPPSTADRAGLRVVRLEQAVVESWAVLPTLVKRAPAIVAVRERWTTPRRLAEVLEVQPRVAGAREQRKLFDQLAAGNHSELEIWGHERVFADRRLPRSVTQHRLQVGSRYVLLDRAFLDEMVAVELDGAAYHGSPGQREKDLRRDAAVARLGWVTVRYSHPRLHSEPDGVIEELAAVLARRREQLRTSA
ncbi:MAG TPA: DUF559 domain-containing protein [Mycobacteriales bacterium]|nr:DUF559 domain-containing protein [Mycobacteriales bacterium]HWC34254.1 DUF559 domain-containing protein [Mycobacteriales bacterium]